jgi:ABC-type Zn uptake system ZnuABC Zn-binding protein ZnuA
MAQNIAGDRLQIDTLIPAGIDPHSYEPTPRDAARIETADILILNGAGFEESLGSILNGRTGAVITASEGLTSRTQDPPDPHFWLDPTLAIQYVENIRDGLIAADPEGRATYTQNAAAYLEEIDALDRWIAEQVETIPPDRRKLVTNHESFGYFADR